MLSRAVQAQEQRTYSTRVDPPLQRKSPSLLNQMRSSIDSGKRPDWKISQQSQQSRLHEIHTVNAVPAVSFCENDFDDDNVINLSDDDPPPPKRVCSESKQDPPLPLPTRRLSPKNAIMDPTPSSTQLDWSSSPITRAQPIQPAPRRKLPWSTTSQSSSSQNKTPRAKHEEDPFPWKMTHSAVKEEQKRVRLENKKAAQQKEPPPTGSQDGGAPGSLMKKSKNKALAQVFLSDEQRQVLDLVSAQRKSVFFTGSAGTGKSVLLREIIKKLREKYRKEPDRIAVTASTGLAACNVGGVTLHSFAGIGLGKDEVPELVKKIRRNAKAKQRWLRTNVLIVDEISMVDGELFDKLENVARCVRSNGRPFGGIQLIITGDFFQLPPVPDYGKQAKFAFEAATWTTSIDHTIGLTQVFRQKDPSWFFLYLPALAGWQSRLVSSFSSHPFFVLIHHKALHNVCALDSDFLRNEFLKYITLCSMKDLLIL